MLRSTPEWEAFERNYIRGRPADYHWALRVFEEMYAFACAMGAFPLQDPLEDLDKDIQLVKDLESLPRSAAR